MFEADQITRMLSYKQDFLNYKIILFCKKCKKRIETCWRNDYSLKGDFVSSDRSWSEVLDITVNSFDDIICYDCINSFQRRRLCSKKKKL